MSRPLTVSRTAVRTLAVSVSLAVGAATLLTSVEASAYKFVGCGYTITGFDGDGCPVGFADTDGCGCTADSAPTWYGGQVSMRIENQGIGGISAAQFVQAGRNAANSWTQVSCSTLAVDASQTFPGTSSPSWGNHDPDPSTHDIYFVAGENEWMEVTGAGAGGTLGVTVSPYQGFGCSGREFYDSDILINGFVRWGWTPTSLEETVLHEMGHSLGLDHPCLSGYSVCNNSCFAVMAASSGDYTTPQQDDVNALCALYPGTPGGLGAACDSPSECDSGPCIAYQGFQYCSQTCTGSCVSGYECRAVGGEDVCVRLGVPAIGDACVAQCASGALCLAGDSNSGGVCYAECDPNAASCPGVGDRCLGLVGGGGACLPAGDLGPGEVCTAATQCGPGLLCIEGLSNVAYCEIECDPTQPGSCSSGFACADIGEAGVCIPSAVLGEACDDRVCIGDTVCVGGASGYFCRRDCDPAIASTCSVTESCASLEGGGGACFPTGDADAGDACLSGTDCIPGAACISRAAGGGECLLLCDPSNSFCPLDGQSCLPLAGSSDGVCDPATGGTACSCDTTDACEASCICDTDCGNDCSCNMTTGCDANCACDPGCVAPCACDLTAACEAGCACDADCTTVCDCDVAQGTCDSGCACDPDCLTAACECDTTYYCDARADGSECACDTECPCTCDLTYDTCECACDVDCAEEGCQGCAGAAPSGLLLLAGGFAAFTRRWRFRSRSR